MTVDLSKIKPGDEVLVKLIALKCTPEEDRDDRHGWIVDCHNNVCASVLCGDLQELKAWVRSDAIVSHTPKALATGDRVLDWGGYGNGTILFMDERDVVVRWDEGGIHSGQTSGWGAKLRRAS